MLVHSEYLNASIFRNHASFQNATRGHIQKSSNALQNIFKNIFENHRMRASNKNLNPNTIFKNILTIHFQTLTKSLEK